jgi:PAS domain S-box-containing protein
MKSPFAFSVMKGKDMVITLANSLIKEFWGKGNEVEGKTLLQVLPELKDQPFPEMISQVFTTGIPVYANEILGKVTYNGQLKHKYFNVVFQPYYEADNSISGVTQIAYDVTEMVLARKKIEESDKRYNLMLMHSPFTFAVLKGKDLVINLANDRLKEVWGKGNDVEGKSLFEIMPGLNDTPFPALMDEVIATSIPYHGIEVQRPHNIHGHTRKEYFNFVFQPYLEADETVSGITIIGHDVTEQVIAKRKIEESEERFHNLIYTSPSAIGILLGEDLVITIANKPIIEIWGKGKEIVGKKYFEALPELAEQGYKEVFNQVYKTGIPFNAIETPVNILQNGVTTLKYYNFILYPQKNTNGEINGIGIIATEVTSQALLHINLKESEGRFRSLVEKSPYPICIFKGKELKIEVANESMLKIFNVGAEALGKPFLEILPEMKEQPFIELLLDVLENGTTHYGSEQPAYFLRRNGKKETLYFNFVYQPYRENDGSATGVMVLSTDVTEQVLARKKVEDSEFSFQNMVYTSPSMIAIFKGEDMIIEIANDAIIESWGKGKDVIGKSLLSIMPEIIEQGFDKILSDVYKTGIPFHAYEAPVSLIRNGKLELLHYTFVYQAQRNINGAIEGVAIIANEVTPQALLNINLKESEARFRLLADSVPIHIFIIEPDADATISYWNKNWLDYTGQSFEEAIGNTWTGIIHPHDVQGIMEIYVPAFEKRESYVLPAIRIKRYDGTYQWHSVQASPRYLLNGEFIGYIGIGFDIHEQKLLQDALKQSEKHFRLMGDLMPSKISNANANGDVIYFNKNWLDFSGYTFEELRDFGYQKIMHPDEIEEFQQRLQKAAETGTDLVMEMRFKNKQGDYIWHLNIASPIKDKNGVLKMWVGVSTEMQHQKEQREDLEHLVAERTLELSAANEGLKKMNKELEAFNYVSSHDLQEPLRKIQTFVSRILEKENQNLSDNGKVYFRFIQNSAERMQTLIQDLLAFSRLSMTDRKFETTDLNIIIEEVKNEFKEIIAEKNAVIEVEEICEVHIIPFQFRQLIHNLISNALKFSNPKIPPHIKISSANITSSKINVASLLPNKKYCHITISDNGIGFEKEFAEKIFEVFQKLHSKDEYAGTGIGLAIVKKIVDNHNGIITATSELNKGTRFDIYLPT